MYDHWAGQVNAYYALYWVYSLCMDGTQNIHMAAPSHMRNHLGLSASNRRVVDINEWCWLRDQTSMKTGLFDWFLTNFQYQQSNYCIQKRYWIGLIRIWQSYSEHYAFVLWFWISCTVIYMYIYPKAKHCIATIRSTPTDCLVKVTKSTSSTAGVTCTFCDP